MNRTHRLKPCLLLLLIHVFLVTSLIPAGGIPSGASGGIRNSSFVILRAEPRLESEAVAVLPFMEELTVTEDLGDWVRVRCSKGSGYMRRLYLKYGEGETAAAMPSRVSPGEEGLKEVRLGSERSIVHHETVLMRSAASLHADCPAELAPGSPVRVLEVLPGWSRVEWQGRTGYVRNRYLGLADDARGIPTAEREEPSSSVSGGNPPATINPSTGRIQDPGIQGKAYEGPGSLTAADGQKDDSWRSGFQRENAISDHEFTDAGRLSQPQIQSFLESKNSVLARPVNGLLPSQAIYDAARRHGINPQVILARLQTEQGLVSKKTASQKQLDWALGVGAYDSGNWNQKYKGFDKQVDGAAQTMRRWYDDGKARGSRVALTIDGQKITTANASTYSLYKYTPHFAGTELNWKVYTGYFK